jgi:hypothetical protein
MASLDSTQVLGDLVVTGAIHGAADRLNVSPLIGSGVSPVFFQNGVPSACNYYLLASVPAVSTAQNGYVLQVVNGVLTPVQLYQYSATDLTAGTSSLATGSLYFVYE